MRRQSDSQFVRHEPCPACGSRDNLARYSDGHAYCFGCGYYERGEGDGGCRPREDRRVSAGLLQGEARPLPSRKISEATAAKWGYRVAQDERGRWCQVADYLDASGAVVAQKVRYPGKEFVTRGDMRAALPLYGQWLWAPRGRMVVVTEGEIDALSVSQVWDNKWPVVSVPNGANGAAKAVGRAIEWLSGFDSVVFAFDMDEPGQQAARACADMLPPGKARIARLPAKDANECLQQGKAGALIDALWQAQEYRPDGIVDGRSLWDAVVEGANVDTVPSPWSFFDDHLLGLRRGELMTITAGTGIGKSTLAREIVYHLLCHGESVGLVMLEEPVRRTALDLMGLHLNRRLRLSREGVTDEQLRDAFNATVGSGRCYLYDHFGSTDTDNLLNKIRYLARGCGCGWVVLDHVSIVVSALDDGDERKAIDRIMTLLRTLVSETGIGLIVVSHLKRVGESRAHEEGGRVSLSHLRGSQAIAQLSDTVIAAERDQQAGEDANKMLLRSLKDRLTGYTGVLGELVYDSDTGRLVPCLDMVLRDEPEGAASDF